MEEKADGNSNSSYRALTLVVVLALLVAACGQATGSPGATGTAAGTPPAATEPAGTEPAGTEPAGTEPAGTEPAGTEPAGTEPAGTEPAGTEPAATVEPTPVTGAACAPEAPVVEFWTSHTPPDSDTLTAMVEQFNGANTDLCVEMTIVPGGETDVTKLLTALRSGTAPDVYMVDRFTVPQRASDGVLAELTGLPPDLPASHVEFAWNETQFQGKTYALPFDTDARALFYNKDMYHGGRHGPVRPRHRERSADGGGGPGDRRRHRHRGCQRQPGCRRLRALEPRSWQWPGMALHVGLRLRR